MIPKTKRMIFAGRRILSAIRLRGISGDCAFLSTTIKEAMEIVVNAATETKIIKAWLESMELVLMPLVVFAKYVSVSKNEVIAIAKVTAPLKSISGL